MRGGHVIFTLAFLAAAMIAAAAPAVDVAYIDGSAQFKSGSAWKELDFGQKLEPTATLRLAAGTVVELDVDGGRSILLSKPGVYDLAALIKAAPETKGSAARLLGILDRITSGSSVAAPSTQAGVRGSPGDTRVDPFWPDGEEDPSMVYDAGRDAEAEGRYAEAAVLYGEALRIVKDQAETSELRAGMAAYSAARAFVQAEQFGRALDALKAADPADAGDARGAYAMLYAMLLADFGDADAARTLLLRGKAEAWFTGPAAGEADALLATLKK